MPLQTDTLQFSKFKQGYVKMEDIDGITLINYFYLKFKPLADH